MFFSLQLPDNQCYSLEISGLALQSAVVTTEDDKRLDEQIDQFYPDENATSSEHWSSYTDFTSLSHVLSDFSATSSTGSSSSSSASSGRQAPKYIGPPAVDTVLLQAQLKATSSRQALEETFKTRTSLSLLTQLPESEPEPEPEPELEEIVEAQITPRRSGRSSRSNSRNTHSSSNPKSSQATRVSPRAHAPAPPRPRARRSNLTQAQLRSELSEIQGDKLTQDSVSKKEDKKGSKKGGKKGSKKDKKTSSPSAVASVVKRHQTRGSRGGKTPVTTEPKNSSSVAMDLDEDDDQHDNKNEIEIENPLPANSMGAGSESVLGKSGDPVTLEAAEVGEDVKWALRNGWKQLAEKTVEVDLKAIVSVSQHNL